jgi:hypothetical protein
MKNNIQIIRDYIDAYNNFDIEKMLADLDDDILFENISNGEINMSLHGLAAFKVQAEQAKSYFLQRHQTILSFQQNGNQTEIEIDYSATLALDFPNGLKKGDEIKLKGKSIFTISEGKISRLVDIS